MSLIGGLVGILLGWGISEIAGQLTDELQPVMQMNTILLATGFAGSVGAIFGIYSAWRAARLRPIDALRYE